MRIRFSLRALLLLVAMMAFVMSIVIRESTRHRERRRIEFGKELRAQTSVLLDNYVSIRGVLPLAVTLDQSGTPLYSWRFELVPYSQSSDFTYLDFTKAWNMPPNNKLTGICPPPYCFERTAGVHRRCWTNVFAIVGQGTAFDRRSLQHVDPDTILLIETRNSGVHWMEPGDLNVQSMPRTIGIDGGICGVFRTGFHVAFVDGEVWYLKHSIPFETLSKFFTIRGAKEFRREDVLSAYRID